MTRTYDNLPALTREQAAVVGAMASPHASIHEAAAALDLDLGRFFDLLAAPEVRAHINHIRKSLETRLRMRLADAAHQAVDVLEEIARNSAESPTIATTERRRAAAAILRACAAPRSRRARPQPRTIDVKRINTLLARIEQSDPADQASTPAPVPAPVNRKNAHERPRMRTPSQRTNIKPTRPQDRPQSDHPP